MGTLLASDFDRRTPSTGTPYQLGQQVPYGIAMVQANPLPDTYTGNRTLCIIDSGIDLAHEDLHGNHVTGDTNPGTGNWYTDENHHGTHVAGTTVTTIPSVGVSDTEGASLLTQLGQQANLTVTATNYALDNGTSMATPHVSAVAALVWSYFPQCSASQIRDALDQSALDLGTPGRAPLLWLWPGASPGRVRPHPQPGLRQRSVARDALPHAESHVGGGCLMAHARAYPVS